MTPEDRRGRRRVPAGAVGLLLLAALAVVGASPAAASPSTTGTTEGAVTTVTTDPDSRFMEVPAPRRPAAGTEPAGPGLTAEDPSEDAPAYLVWGLVLSAVATVAAGVVLVRSRRG